MEFHLPGRANEKHALWENDAALTRQGQVTGVVLLWLTHSPNDLDEDPFVSAAIELGVENPLPWAQIELSGGYRDDHLVVHQHGFQMRVAVGFTGLVVLIIRIPWSELFKPPVDILDESFFVVVDIDSSCDVHR